MLAEIATEFKLRDAVRKGKVGLFAGIIGLGFVVAFLSMGRLPHRVEKRLQRTRLILSGHLIDVGGHRIQLECRGNGSPTVLMDSGLDMKLNSWGEVPAAVAAFTRVCTYNRPGLGYSDIGPKPRTSKTIVNELETLLINAGISGPYVLVGHRFGGLNVRLYASQHPDKVAGVVLIDASNENQYPLLAAVKSEDDRKQYLHFMGGANSEGIDLLANAAEFRGAHPFPAVPLLVLTASQRDDEGPKEAQVMEQMQADLVKLAPNGKQLIVDTRKSIQLDRPFLVADSIFVVVRAAREHSQIAMDVR